VAETLNTEPELSQLYFACQIKKKRKENKEHLHAAHVKKELSLLPYEFSPDLERKLNRKVWCNYLIHEPE